MNFSRVSFRALGDFPAIPFLIVNILTVFLYTSFRVWGPSFLLALAFCVFSLFYFYFLLACLSVSQYYWCFQESGWCFWFFSFCVSWHICIYVWCTHVYVCLHVWVCVCSGAHSHMCTCLWRPAVDTGHPPHYFSLCLLKQVTSGENQRALRCNGGFLASGEQRLGG